MHIKHRVRPSSGRGREKHRLANWFTTEYFALKLIGLILGAFVLVVLLSAGGKHLYLQVAKHTFLQSFYSSAEAAKELAEPLKINNYLGQNESSIAPSFWELTSLRRAYLGDCIFVRYTIGDMSGKNGYKCEKGFNTYYGLSRTEPQTLEAAHNELLMRGWNLTARDDNSIKAALDNYALNKPSYLAYFKGNLSASIATLPLSQQTKCNGHSICMFAKKDVVKPYDVLLVFGTNAEESLIRISFFRF